MKSKIHLKALTVTALIIIWALNVNQARGFQSNISGNIKNVRAMNKYPHTSVTAISGPTRVTVSNPAGFSAGDTVLLIQMQGVGIYTMPYGQFATKFGEPGLWEFITVSAVAGNELTFVNNLKAAYNAIGNIQIIKVPSFPNVTVTGSSDLTCDPWDPVTKSGGVLAMIVGNELKLQKNIDVTGLGFRGGNADLGTGICQITNASYQAEYYADSYTNAGRKGEGIAIHNSSGALLLPANAKGRGANFTGGGGGNGAYSGGGGGSNRGTGGVGGNEEGACLPKLGGGIGGTVGEFNPILLNRIFMGGGGGASTRSATGTTGPGGNGGGIVIIIANAITGIGGNILAKGAKGGDGGGAGPSGAGGGGGGGTIALSASAYWGTFKANVEGGNGGDNPGRLFGEGGGGGAGLVWLTVDNAGNINPLLNGGSTGGSNEVSADAGTAGEKRLALNPKLNSFLFNSICSSVSGNQYDSIPVGTVPPKISGTVPLGGTAPYTISWEKSYDQLFTSPITLSGTGTNLIPTGTETSTVWFRRKITDSGLPLQLIDISQAVRISMRITTSAEKTPAPGSLLIYPNPANEELTIEFSHELTGRMEISITSLSGRTVMSLFTNKSEKLFNYLLPVSDLAPGIYNLTLTINGLVIAGSRMIKK